MRSNRIVNVVLREVKYGAWSVKHDFMHRFRNYLRTCTSIPIQTTTFFSCTVSASELSRYQITVAEILQVTTCQIFSDYAFAVSSCNAIERLQEIIYSSQRLSFWLSHLWSIYSFSEVHICLFALLRSLEHTKRSISTVRLRRVWSSPSVVVYELQLWGCIWRCSYSSVWTNTETT